MGKNKNKNRFPSNKLISQPVVGDDIKNPATSGIPSNANLNNTKVITQSEYDEYQRLKLSLDDRFKIDLTEYRKNKEKQIDDEINRENQKNKAILENKLNQELNPLQESIKSAKIEKASLEKEISAERLNRDKSIEGAKEQAKQIIENAKKEAEKANEVDQKNLALKQKELGIRENEIAGKETELEAKYKIIKLKETSIATMEKIYMEANPDKVSTLGSEIKQKQAYIDELRADYLALRNTINENETLQLKLNGRSPEYLIKENEQLLDQISKLEDKCNKFTEFELGEMKRAFDEEPLLRRQIEERTREIQAKTNELNRLKNNILELEQARAQLDLIRNLNDHLRQELETSKRALESRVGEVCPALTEIDIEEADDKGLPKANFENRQKLANNIKPSLFDIVQHVKRYAASQPIPLFYEEKDIRAFLAGLASSRLAIIQGLSGTGKTSLPKVFIDALSSEKRVVPVASSWRDRNELFGYYNDFNRKFTAKEFTCHLYRAGMPNYSDTLFFIILDEMNLSRVEYYFADFLSVLEDNLQEIKLVDVDLRSLPMELTKEIIELIEQDNNDRAKELINKIYDTKNLEIQKDIKDPQEKAELIGYLNKCSSKNGGTSRNLLNGPQQLINGNIIKIPKNVWFIGTANRDESTFEITDKVYDRAQVLNFNSRASGQKENYHNTLYVPFKDLNKLFNDAMEANPFDSMTDPLVDKIDRQLKEKFKITFGNRITMQMNRFVPVYISAGMTRGKKVEDLKREAIDYQLTNKVLRKLEYKQISKENLDELKELFEGESLTKGSEFIDWKRRNEV